MAIFGGLIFIFSVFFDPVFRSTNPSASRPGKLVDSFYYSLTIIGIVSLFFSQTAQRNRDKLESDEVRASRNLDDAIEKKSDIEKQINNTEILIEHIREAASKNAAESRSAHSQACACAISPALPSCVSLSPALHIHLESPAKKSPQELLEISEEYSRDCNYLENQRETITWMDRISHDLDILKIQTVIKEYNLDFTVTLGDFTVSGLDAARLVNDNGYRQQFITSKTAALNRQIDKQNQELTEIESERDKKKREINSLAFWTYWMEAYWPAFLLAGVGLKLSQSPFFSEKAS
jgi:hypothetical protein